MIRIILILVFTLITLKANAQVTFESYINKNPIKENDLVELTIMCIGGNLDYEPEISSLKDFDIIGHSSTNQMQIINGNIVSSESYIYKLVAKKTGKLIIPPITGYINNNKYQTKEIKIEVLGDKNPEKIDDTKIAYLKAEVNKKEPFLNEQIIYTLKFYRRVNTEKNNLTIADFKDFTVEDFGKQKDYQTEINGRIYAVTEIKKILIPNKSGLIKIPESQLLVEIPYKDDNDFFGYSVRKETKNLKSETLELKVKSLPDNLSEIVSSKIDYDINISSKEIKLGGSIDLKINFVGEGNIYDINLDDLNINNSKVYQDKSNSKNFIKDGILFSEKKFSFGIVPLNSGKTIINIPKIIFFNPNKKKYESINIKPLEINVIGSQNTNQNNLNKKVSEKEVQKNDTAKIINNEEKISIKIDKNILLIIAFTIFIIILLFMLLKFKKKDKKTYKNKKVEIININSENFEEVYKAFINFRKNNKIPDNKTKEFNDLEEEFYKIKFSNNYNENDKKEVLRKANSLIKTIFDSNNSK